MLISAISRKKKERWQPFKLWEITLQFWEEKKQKKKTHTTGVGKTGKTTAHPVNGRWEEIDLSKYPIFFFFFFCPAHEQNFRDHLGFQTAITCFEGRTYLVAENLLWEIWVWVMWFLWCQLHADKNDSSALAVYESHANKRIKT